MFISKFHNYIFMKLSLLAKFAKVSSLENFRLYGENNILYAWCGVPTFLATQHAIMCLIYQ